MNADFHSPTTRRIASCWIKAAISAPAMVFWTSCSVPNLATFNHPVQAATTERPNQSNPANPKINDSFQTKAATAIPSGEMLEVVQNKSLSLSDCLELALRTNLDTRIRRAKARAAETEIDRVRGTFDFAWEGEVYDGIDSDQSVAAGMDLRKKFITGTEIRLESGSRIDGASEISEEIGESSEAEYGVRIVQPLLQGAGSRYHEADFSKARLIADSASQTVVAQALLTLRMTETAYWTAAVTKRVVAIQSESLERTRKIVTDVTQRREIGTATRLDLLEAEGALAKARENLVIAKKKHADSVEGLKYLLGIPLTAEHPDWSLDQISKSYDNRTAPSPDDVFVAAIDRSPDAILLANEVTKNKLTAFQAKRDLLPRLDFEVYASQPEDSDLQPTSRNDWESIALLRLSMPWGRRAQKAEFAEAKANLEASSLSLDQGLQRLQKDISEACRSIESGRETLSVATHSLKVQSEKWTEQLQRHSEGLISIRDLMEAETELREAEISELAARLDLIAAWSSLTQLDGSIAERHGLEFMPMDETGVSFKS